MSDAKKCDRCGAYFKPSTKTRFVQEYFSVNGTRCTANGGDMCEKCAAKFAKWWHKKRKEGGDD